MLIFIKTTLDKKVYKVRNKNTMFIIFLTMKTKLELLHHVLKSKYVLYNTNNSGFAFIIQGVQWARK